MLVLHACFWLCAGLVLYTYVGYPLLVAAMARFHGRPVRAMDRPVGSLSVVLAAHNEERTIRRRVRELLDLVEATGVQGELIVVSDGSTDGTASAARATGMAGAGRQRRERAAGLQVIELPRNCGKAVALNAGCAVASGEVIAFADARQSWTPDTLPGLLEPFGDPSVGAVSGELVLQSRPGVMAGVGLYWRYEKWLRRQESRWRCMTGATGAVSAVRRELYQPLPAGTILDDVYWPLCVAMRGFRVVHQQGAVAFDQLPERPRDEFRRKVRTLGGLWQLLGRLPRLLLPWRNPVWFQFLSHKLLRLLVPWALLLALAVSAVLPGRVYGVALWIQVACYTVGLLGLWPAVASRLRGASAAASLLVLNSAAFLSFWVWVLGRCERSWRKAAYTAVPDDSACSSVSPN